MILLFILYLIIFQYYNKRIKTNIQDNIETKTSSSTLQDMSNKYNCTNKQIYCVKDSDCLQMCSLSNNEDNSGNNSNNNDNNNKSLIQYKCSKRKICVQSINDNTSDNNNQNSNSKILCNKKLGFFLALVSDEIFESYWTCLNSRPYLFNDKQEYHSYICAGGNRDSLDPDNIFDSCKCSDNQIKVRDEFRNYIPICIDSKDLPLYPNFTII